MLLPIAIVCFCCCLVFHCMTVSWFIYSSPVDGKSTLSPVVKFSYYQQSCCYKSSCVISWCTCADFSRVSTQDWIAQLLLMLSSSFTRSGHALVHSECNKLYVNWRIKYTLYFTSSLAVCCQTFKCIPFWWVCDSFLFQLALA